jgi:hypothetical protein
MNEREQKIIQLAKGCLAQKPLDEATIDANFLFRFDTGWCEWVNKIRQMMWALIGETNNNPLPSESGMKLYVHLDSNLGLSVGMEITPESTKLTMNTETGSYRCFDSDLQEKYQEAIRHIVKGNNKEDIDKLHQQMWREANQTAKIQDELWRLAKAYHLVPVTDEESLNFSPREISERFQAVIFWVIRAKIVPSFLWPKTILMESKTYSKIKRTLRPHRWSEHIFPTEESRLRLGTRVRTWTVYYLTKQGGGKRTEQSAIDLWNEEFSDTLDIRNYKNERDRLLKHGCKKG